MDILIKTRNLMSGETSKIETDYVAKSSMTKKIQTVDLEKNKRLRSRCANKNFTNKYGKVQIYCFRLPYSALWKSEVRDKFIQTKNIFKFRIPLSALRKTESRCKQILRKSKIEVWISTFWTKKRKNRKIKINKI